MEEVRSGGGLTTKTSNYSYDDLGRLSQVELPSGTCRRYSFDLDSNRTQIQEATSGGCAGSFTTTSSYAYNPATTAGVDQLTSQTGPTRSFSYDSDGQTTGRGSETISWDSWGRTTGGTFSGTGVSYGYDAAGDVCSRVRSSQTLRYLLDGVFETDGSGVLTTSYADGPAGNLASYAGAPTTSSTTSFLYYNGHGDLAATTDTSGSRSNAYTYDPFGAPNESTPLEHDHPPLRRRLEQEPRHQQQPDPHGRPPLRPRPRPLPRSRPNRRRLRQQLRLRRPRPHQQLRPRGDLQLQLVVRRILSIR
jgi:hypothetical protein